MRKHFLFFFVTLFISLFAVTFDSLALPKAILVPNNKTLVNSPKAKQMLLGKHRLQLQWLSFWDKKLMGSVNITQEDGLLLVEGKQTKGEDFLEIKGSILEVNERDFLFDGKISMRVNYNNDGKVCNREGKMLFRISGARKFWRLKDMLNPCDNTTTDYIDIFFLDTK